MFGARKRFQHDPHWCDYVRFYECFQGDNGAGVGASHQTVWTGLVAQPIQQQGEHHTLPAIETGGHSLMACSDICAGGAARPPHLAMARPVSRCERGQADARDRS
jgi:hypothetical protein